MAQEWCGEDVARRWWQLFPKRRGADGRPANPQTHELGMLTVDEDALAERRRREIGRQYEELADIQRRRGQHDKAAELLEQARQYD